MAHPSKARIDDLCACDRKLQMLLVNQWREWPARGIRPPNLADVEFRTLSQNGEDGILLYLFTLIGATNKRVVELCAGNGEQCNAANLIVNHGWHGLLVDGSAGNIDHARRLYSSLADTFLRPPTTVHAWITAENINDLIRAHGFDGDIDLLSIDIDGNDYWLWKAIDCVRPRVVVVEYNGIWGPDRAVTIPYDPEFVMDATRAPIYGGASLAAFDALARARGFRFVGVERTQINAFFVRDDLAADLLPRADLACGLGYAVPVDWEGRDWLDV